MGQWIAKKGPKVQSEVVARKDKQIDGMDSSDSSDSSDSEFVPIKPNKVPQARTSVSGEAFGRFNQKADFKPKFVQKNQGQIDRIKKRLGASFMFSALDQKEQDIVVGAMEEVHFRSGDAVITYFFYTKNI
jgi:cAMP-dependent protein kinase regulator